MCFKSDNVIYVQVYCEMEINGGGYLFLENITLLPGGRFTDIEFQNLATNKTAVLLVTRNLNNSVVSQYYGEITQLSIYKWAQNYLISKIG